MYTARRIQKEKNRDHKLEIGLFGLTSRLFFLRQREREREHARAERAAQSLSQPREKGARSGFITTHCAFSPISIDRLSVSLWGQLSRLTGWLAGWRAGSSRIPAHSSLPPLSSRRRRHLLATILILSSSSSPHPPFPLGRLLRRLGSPPLPVIIAASPNRLPSCSRAD